MIIKIKHSDKIINYSVTNRQKILFCILIKGLFVVCFFVQTISDLPDLFICVSEVQNLKLYDLAVLSYYLHKQSRIVQSRGRRLERFRIADWCPGEDQQEECSSS